MESTFRNLDRTIQSQPMPAEFNDTKALIYCNDCGAKSVVKYHWLGLRCDMCESYNTAQIRLMNRDILDSVEDDYAREGFIASRTRSSSQGTGNIALPVLTTSILDPNSGHDIDSNARFNAPVSAESSGRFSYSISRGRAVSPVISNYFGIPPDRGSERPNSTSFFNGRALQENEDENSGEIRFWGAKFKYRYGFLSRGTHSVGGTSEANDEEDEDEFTGDDDERSWCSNSDEDKEEEDDDDEEKIDIFGHR
ncbi:CHY and RING finger domain protein [Aspergillus arachidicola]|nr:CHY and RING finger domain protein [Aspergillus arachidicola]